MAQSLAERGAGALFNELFAVAEKSEQLSSRFAFLGNLFEIPNWVLLDSALSLFLNYIDLSHPRPVLKYTLRQRTQHRYRHNLLWFLFVHDRSHRHRRRWRRSRRRRWHLLIAPRLCQVVDGGEAAERRLESLGGRRHADAGQPDLKSARSFHAHLRTLASSSSSGGGRLGREWKRSTEHSCFPASATSPSTSLFVSSMSRFGTGYRTALSIFTLPSILRTDRS